MNLPIAIHKEDGSVFGVSVPDITGCYSWGDTIEEAIYKAREAIINHLEVLLDLGETPEVKASAISDLVGLEDYRDAIWAMVDIDLSMLDPTPERVNISLPRYVLMKIDQHTKEKHETRSGFLARAAMHELAHG